MAGGWIGVRVVVDMWGVSHALCTHMHAPMHTHNHMHAKHDKHGCLHVGGHL